ncbi:unnamed protein product [Phytophthora fragariaefolia]|uniref:Unnamed protein product n=1 Tax=Phytophthora fragariaefolia TaxID=1490495 RepID=A0A9W7CME2_9STRA|nr:unnamed protein product [Phytophthora fragariaefolia]
MKGDVKAAYKHLRVHEAVSAYFTRRRFRGSRCSITIRLDGLSSPLWCVWQSISHLVRRESPKSLNPHDPNLSKFFCFDWVDDHVLVEYDTGNRLQACDCALRLAMTAVLGPRAINNKKFTDWSSKVVALGLEWGTSAMTVSMPNKNKGASKQQKLTINIREQFSALLATLCWGHCWSSSSKPSLVHIRFRIDNSAAVFWRKLASSNPFSQEINRIFGALEAEQRIHVSAKHLAGSTNFLADLGSCAWSNPRLAQWPELTSSWSQVTVPESVQKAYNGSWSPFSSDPFRHLQTAIRRHVGEWISFCHRIGRSPWLPEHDPLSHIKWHHKVFAGFKPAIDASHATAISGMRPCSPPIQPRAPVSISMLEWMVSQVEYKKPEHRLILGAAMLGFFYLLRISEYLEVKTGRHRYTLQVRDEVLDIAGSPAVNFNEPTNVVIQLRGSKTDQRGESTVRQLARSGHAHVCPVIAAALLIELANRHELRPTDPMCVYSRGRMLKAEELSKVLKAATRGVGLDPQ